MGRRLTLALGVALFAVGCWVTFAPGGPVVTGSLSGMAWAWIMAKKWGLLSAFVGVGLTGFALYPPETRNDE